MIYYICFDNIKIMFVIRYNVLVIFEVRRQYMYMAGASEENGENDIYIYTLGYNKRNIVLFILYKGVICTYVFPYVFPVYK